MMYTFPFLGGKLEAICIRFEKPKSGALLTDTLFLRFMAGWITPVALMP